LIIAVVLRIDWNSSQHGAWATISAVAVTISSMFRLGFLQCDSLDAPHVDVDGDYDTLFAELLAPHDIGLVTYRADRGELPTSTQKCDAWLIPGSRHSVNDDLDWITELARFTDRILEESRPLVGVCFGHQLIAKVLGAPVGRAASGWTIGAIDYQLAHSPPGECVDPTDAQTGEFTIAASHMDQVAELPAGTKLLAESPTCPVAGFFNDSVLTVQAHPEFTAALAASLYESRVERIGREPVEAALASLDRPLARERVTAWIASFLLERG
jgi:GMP synthase-like glutamine amidotransferase